MEMYLVFIGGLILGMAGGVTAALMKARKEDNSMIKTSKLIEQVREIVQSQLLNNHPTLFQAIAKQKIIINKHERSAVAIFISADIFKDLIYNAGNHNSDQVDLLYESMRDLKMPVGFLGELPIYTTELMDSPVFVVGSISWEM